MGTEHYDDWDPSKQDSTGQVIEPGLDNDLDSYDAIVNDWNETEGNDMTTYYKAVRPDGTDFYSGTAQWAPPEGHEGEWVVRHPTATEIGADPSSYLSVSTVPTDCVGMKWPCRLFEVEAVEDTELDPRFRHKMAGLEFRVVRELDSHIALGPQGEHVAALIDRAARLTGAETGQLGAAWAAAREAARGAAWTAALGAAWAAAWAAAREAAREAARGAALGAAWDARDAAWDAAWDAALGAAWAAARGAAWDAAREADRDAALDAARGLLVRDLISAEHYDVLTRPWRTAVGPIHPDDPDIREEQS